MKLHVLFLLKSLLCLSSCAVSEVKQDGPGIPTVTQVEFPKNLGQIDEVTRDGYEQLKSEIIAQEIRGRWLCFAVIEFQDRIVGDDDRIIEAFPQFYRVRK